LIPPDSPYLCFAAGRSGPILIYLVSFLFFFACLFFRVDGLFPSSGRYSNQIATQLFIESFICASLADSRNHCGCCPVSLPLSKILLSKAENPAGLFFRSCRSLRFKFCGTLLTPVSLLSIMRPCFRNLSSFIFFLDVSEIHPPFGTSCSPNLPLASCAPLRGRRSASLFGITSITR